MLIAIWNMGGTGELYNDPGAAYYARLNPKRARKGAIHQLEAMGYRVNARRVMRTNRPLTEDSPSGVNLRVRGIVSDWLPLTVCAASGPRVAPALPEGKVIAKRAPRNPTHPGSAVCANRALAASIRAGSTAGTSDSTALSWTPTSAPCLPMFSPAKAARDSAVAGVRRPRRVVSLVARSPREHCCSGYERAAGCNHSPRSRAAATIRARRVFWLDLTSGRVRIMSPKSARARSMTPDEGSPFANHASGSRAMTS
jgi:hypothetical protein